MTARGIRQRHHGRRANVFGPDVAAGHPECADKRSYDTRQQAGLALRALADAEGLHPYRCSLCSAWHLGHAASAGSTP